MTGDRRVCRKCGGHYQRGEYRDHAASLAHLRELERLAKTRRVGR